MTKLQNLSSVFNLGILTSKRKNPDLVWHGSRVLVKALSVKAQTTQGIYRTEKQQKQGERLNNLCEILAVGDEVEFFNVGDIVLTLQYSGRQLYIPELANENLHVIAEADVYATIFKKKKGKKNAPKRGKK